MPGTPLLSDNVSGTIMTILQLYNNPNNELGCYFIRKYWLQHQNETNKQLGFALLFISIILMLQPLFSYKIPSSLIIC